MIYNCASGMDSHLAARSLERDMANKSLVIESEMALEQKVLTLIGCIAHEQKASLERLIAPMRLSLLQLNILHTLDKSSTGRLTVNQLKAAMFDENANVSRTLNKLGENGLISKERCLTDQRTVYVSITPNGRKAHRDADKSLLTHSTGLDQNDLQTLYTILKKL
ncbi:MarR family winged helix-turn-helix transcriptional regulator [Sneathiella aquimaris]|uniref:MarR family winged helix-turn-helix transcriptional regulator n=1 Tax=Sneathiella aquimaris TaxID=2599305 RepID=UPI001CA4F4A5|nr:MarR family transcriptional regulator [Sneathiella aquimaris]